MSEEKQADTHKRKRESHSDDTHLRVVLLHSEGYSYSEIVAATHLPEGTVKTIIHRSQQRHSTHKKHKGGNHKAVWGDDVRKLVCDMQSADPAASLLDLQHAVDICLPVTPSCVNTIWRMLQTADFTTKKLYPIPEARNSERVKQERKEWVESVVDSLTAVNTVFIDDRVRSSSATGREVRRRRLDPRESLVISFGASFSLYSIFLSSTQRMIAFPLLLLHHLHLLPHHSSSS